MFGLFGRKRNHDMCDLELAEINDNQEENIDILSDNVHKDIEEEYNQVLNSVELQECSELNESLAVEKHTDELNYIDDLDLEIEYIENEENLTQYIQHVDDEIIEEKPDEQAVAIGAYASCMEDDVDSSANLELEDEDLVYIEEMEDEDTEEEQKSFLNFIKTKLGFWLGLGTFDRVLLAVGALLLVVSIGVAGVYLNARQNEKQVTVFAPIGEELGGLGIIGEDTMLAIANANMAAEEVAEDVEDLLEKEYEESELNDEIKVVMKLSSIVKDLKIKFVNNKTGKLVPNIPFEVTITGESGSSFVKVDDDKDGIIYISGMKSGDVTVAMSELTGIENITYSTEPIKGTVKEDPAYEKVDIKDEIKDESQVDASKEDSNIEMEEESKLQDTVAWVESTKTAIGSEDTYEKADKSNIADPSQTARTEFVQMAEVISEPTTTPDEPTDSTTAVVAVTGVSITGGGSVKVGESIVLSASVEPADASNASVVWQTDGESIAVVDGNGTVTGVSPGTATITVITTDGAKTASTTVTVEEPAPTTVAVTGVSLDKTTVSLIEKGGAVNVVASITPENATNKNITWSSSDSSVASVSGGSITPMKAGSTTITATTEDGKFSASCTVTVTAATVDVTSVSLNHTTIALGKGKTSQLEATVLPNNATNKGVTWSSNNTAVAAVNQSGLVTAGAAGNATITATTQDGNFTATCTVTVAEEHKITIDKEKVTVVIGETIALKATSSNSTAITWSSANGAIATVSSNGEVKGVKAGNTTVTAKAGDQSVTCAVTVTSNAASDNTTLLKDKSGKQVYYKGTDGKYYEAKYADYYKYDSFYYKKSNAEYKYTGWQVIDGSTYFFDANGNKVTGEQVIQGAKYTFASNGVLSVGSGKSGIDVSKWNGNIDWTAVKNSGVSYAIIRCGYRGYGSGALVVDPTFTKNIQGAINAGLKVGVYFFSQAINEAEAIEEASMTLELIKNYKISYPVFLDVEASGGRGDHIDSNTRTNVVKAYCETIRNSGYTAGVYANKNWLETKMNPAAFGNYKIWLAQYATKPTYGGRYDLWQYSKSGKVSGISGNVDMNISYLGY